MLAVQPPAAVRQLHGLVDGARLVIERRSDQCLESQRGPKAASELSSPGMVWAVVIAFVAGCFVGAALGVLALALVQAGSRRPPSR